MNNGGRNELRPYGAGEIVRCSSYTPITAEYRT